MTDMTAASPSRSSTVFENDLILQVIATHLRKHDLLQCTLVNNTWSTLFLPQLWRSFSIWDLFPRNRRRYLLPEDFAADPKFYTQLHKDTMATNAGFIRELIVFSCVIQDIFLPQALAVEGNLQRNPALQYLSCIISRVVKPTEATTPTDAITTNNNNNGASPPPVQPTYVLQPVVDLVLQNQSSLRRLEIIQLYLLSKDHVQSLTDALASLHRLESLTLRIFGVTPGRFLQDILAGVPISCKTLSLGATLGDDGLEPVARMPVNETDETEQDLPLLLNMTVVKLQVKMAEVPVRWILVPLLKRLPNLVSILSPDVQEGPWGEIMARTLARFCPKVNDLDLRGCCDAVCRILVEKGCSGLKKVNYEDWTGFNALGDPPGRRRIVDGLMSHSKDTLEEVELGYGAKNVTGTDLRRVLESCPKLRSLTVNSLLLKGIREMICPGEDGDELGWVCASTLETLVLKIRDYSHQPLDVRKMDKVSLDGLLSNTEEASFFQEPGNHRMRNTTSNEDHTRALIQTQRTMALEVMQLLRQVGQLSNLKFLSLPISVPSINGYFPGIANYRLHLFALLRVNTGLALLGGLDRLEELNVEVSQGSELDRMWGMDEVEWMTEPGRWPKLKRIRGWLHKVRGVADPQQDRKWIEMFQRRRPDVVVD